MCRTSLTFPKVIKHFPVVFLNIPSGPIFTGTVNGLNIIDQVIQHFPVVLKGGGPLINVPSGPMFTGTVNGPKIIDLSKGDPSFPCSFAKHLIWADVYGDSKWAEHY